MHKITIRQEIIDRVLARRGRYHWFEELDPRRTALVVIDMQEVFCAPGAPAEVPASRGIVEPINRLTGELRKHRRAGHLGAACQFPICGAQRLGIVLQLHRRRRSTGEDARSLAPGRQQVWSGLDVAPTDTTIIKNRYSALIAGSSGLERLLRSLDIDTVLIAGTKTNVCCEATARDAMMLDFKVVMVSDCCAALSDDEHRAALENIIQQFGDVMTGEEVVDRLRRRSNR